MALALAVVLGWAACVATALAGSPLRAAALLPLTTFLFTGLFITAHDALHGTVAPGAPRINGAVAAVCLGLYAAFDARKLRASHRRHHAHPASDADPDFARGGYLRWLFTFARRYASARQLVLLALAGNVLTRLCHVEVACLWLGWIGPALLSAVQLFTFGTYLPHRGEHDDVHRARSTQAPRWLAFLQCWNFGYHHEHHARPDVPWWRLAPRR